ncbi:MAG: LapA family protein [Zetaproteobacteria bacterium]|nr:LapA family protein [Zetaproteobacteria bacterium]
MNPYPKRSSIHWLNIVIVIMLTIFGIAFATANLALVHVSFLHLSTLDAPLYMPIFIAFFLGVVGGILSLFFSRRKHKFEIERLQEENALLQQEVENLRNIPLQDDV